MQPSLEVRRCKRGRRKYKCVVEVARLNQRGLVVGAEFLFVSLLIDLGTGAGKYVTHAGY